MSSWKRKRSELGQFEGRGGRKKRRNPHPVDRGERHRERVLDVPEHSSTQVDVVLDKTHSAVSRPASLGVEADDVLVVRIRVGREVSLDEIPRLVGLETEEDMDPVNVSGL